jgi:hypothetical protein
MRRILAAMVLVLLLAPRAWAQGYLRPQVQSAPAPAPIAGQASYDNAALLALYMSQLASAGRAPNQNDIDEAARQYLTNGAAVSTVPTSGPGAAYFQNGAAVMSYGAAPVPPVPAPTATVEPAAANAPTGAPAEAPEPVPVPIPAPVTAPEDNTTSDTVAASKASGVTETQAPNPPSQAAATAPAGATNSYPPAPAQPLYQTILVSTPLASEPGPGDRCPPAPSLASRIAPAFGGLFFGGLAVALWSRPRMIRTRRGDVGPT